MWWMLIPLAVLVIYWIVCSARALPFWKKAQEFPDLLIDHCTQTDGWHIFVKGDKPESTKGLAGPFLHSSSSGVSFRIYIDADRIEHLQRDFLDQLPG